MKKLNVLTVVSRLLIVVMLFETVSQPFVHAQQMKSGAGSRSTPLVADKDALTAARQGNFEPLVEAIKNDDTIPEKIGLNRNDSMLDQDPFFFRSQQWKKAKSVLDVNADAPRYVVDENGFSIQLPGQAKAFRLNAPMHPIFFTDEYIFLAANNGSTLFSETARGLDSAPEGIFIISYQELLTAGAHSGQVPVFYLPMPGQGWIATATKDVAAKEVAEHNLVVFTNTDGEELPVNLDHLQIVLHSERINLMLAMEMAYEDQIREIGKRGGKFAQAQNELADTFEAMAEGMERGENPSKGLQAKLGQSYSFLMQQLSVAFKQTKLRLPRGSTANFGAFFVGFDLDRPNRVTPFESASLNGKGVLQKIWNSVGISSAYANEGAVSGDSPWLKLGKKLTRIVAISAGLYVVAVVLYHTKYKEEMKARGITRKTKGYNDIFVHLLTTALQVPNVWPANVLEYVMDRGRVAEDAKLRKFFNATFGYLRATNNKTPVNEKTGLYGIVYLGMTDTLLVAAQWGWLTPQINGMLGDLFPVLSERAAKSDPSTNPHFASYVVLTVAQNFVAYITSGPSSYQHDIQDITRNEALRIIPSQMKKEGLNPDAPENQAEKERRIDELVRQKLKQGGWPDEKEFILDANTIYQKLQALGGYSAPEGVTAEKAQAMVRQGLVLPALQKAKKRAAEIAKSSGNVVDQQAYEALNEIAKDAGVLSLFSSKRKGRFRAVRSEIVTAIGTDPNAAKVVVPSVWAERFPEGAEKAAELLRNEFFGMQKLGPLSKLRPKPGKDAEKLAVRDVRAASYVVSRWSKNKAAEVLSQLEPKKAAEIIEIFFSGFGAKKTADLIKAFEPQAATDVVSELEPRTMVQVLTALPMKQIIGILGRMPVESLNTVITAMSQKQAEETEKSQREAMAKMYDPALSEGKFARWQLNRAFRKANERMQAQVQTAGMEQKTWEEIFSQELLKAVKLFPDHSNVELMTYVQGQADAAYEELLAKDAQLVKYLNGLSEEERRRVETTLKTDAFASQYVKATIGDERVEAMSPAQPGRFQELRQTKTVRNSPLLTGLLRFTEGFYNDTRYERGLWASVVRDKVPFLGDAVDGNKRVARAFPVAALSGYYWAKYVWGTSYPRDVWFFSMLLAGTTIRGMWTTTNRIMTKMGWKPGANPGSMIKYAVVGSFATFTGGIFVGLFQDDFNKVIPGLTMVGATAGIGYCAYLLTGKKKASWDSKK